LTPLRSPLVSLSMKRGNSTTTWPSTSPPSFPLPSLAEPMYSLLFAVKMTKRLADEIHSNFRRLLDLNHGHSLPHPSSHLSSLVDYSLLFSSPHIASSHEIRFNLSLLVDSFAYRSSCFATQIDDVLALESGEGTSVFFVSHTTPTTPQC
jgi:hypothetical protein